MQTAHSWPRRGDHPAFLNTRLNVSSLLKLEVFALIVIQFLTNMGSLPLATVYILDVVNIALLLIGLKKVAKALERYRVYAILLLLYLALAIATGIGSLTSPLCIAWELLQQMRIPVFVMLALAYWTADDVEGVLRFLYKLQPVNLAFAAGEFFALGFHGDSCGGLFGIAAGSNMMLNMYLVIVFLFACSCYLCQNKKVTLFSLLLTLVSSFFIATLAELKFFYIEAIVIFAISFLVSKKSFKAFAMIAAFVAAFSLGLSVLAIYFPDSYQMLFDIEALRAYDTGADVATSGYGISRSSPISQINSLFFNSGGFLNKILGFGFGSATMSSIDQFCSPFYYSYGWLKYYYSPIAMVYLQNGYLGLTIYLLILLYPIGVAVRHSDYFVSEPWALCFSVGMGALLLINFFYNGSARSYAAILWSICIVLPMLCVSKQSQGALKR